MIRRAQPDAAATIHELMVAAFIEYKPLYTPACYDATVLDPPRIATRMQQGPMWIAEGHEAIGTVGALLDDRGLYIRGMGVHPAAQRQGVARELLDVACSYGREQGVKSAWLSTTTFLSASQSLYRSYGFKPSHGPPDLCGTPLVSFEMPLE